MKPILFNSEMVRAILDGRKTVTRRVIKKDRVDPVLASPARLENPDLPDERFIRCLCDAPYETGDVLYVRETWQFVTCIDCGADEHGACNYTPVTYEDAYSISDGCFIFRADYPETERVSWRPSIHMPKQAARLFLRVTDVRAERLKDILLDPPGPKNQMVREGYKFGADFIAGWQNTIQPKDRETYGWDADPWVWVIGFERIGTEETGDDVTHWMPLPELPEEK